MTRRSTDNRQKKIVAPRGARGGRAPVRVTPPRPVPPRGPKKPDPRGPRSLQPSPDARS